MRNYLILAIAIALPSGCIGAAIGRSKARLGLLGGFVLCALLGPIGWILASRAREADVEPPVVVFEFQAVPGDGRSGWYPDPFGRYDARWWDADHWTSQVAKVAMDGSRTERIDVTSLSLPRPSSPPTTPHHDRRAS